MARKHIIRKFQVVSAGDMSGDVTSTATIAESLDELSYVAVWTGTPTGNLDIQVSNDNGTTWTALTITGVTQPSGSDGSHIFHITSLPFERIRLIYTASSGSGTLNVWMSAKSRGA